MGPIRNHVKLNVCSCASENVLKNLQVAGKEHTSSQVFAATKLWNHACLPVPVLFTNPLEINGPSKTGIRQNAQKHLHFIVNWPSLSHMNGSGTKLYSHFGAGFGIYNLL